MNKSPEGGVVVGYFKGDELSKIVEKLYFESGRMEREYYLEKSNLIFVFERRLQYIRPLSFYTDEGGGVVGKTEENRFYFEDSRLIRLVETSGRTVAKNNPDYKKSEISLMEDLTELVGVLNK